ncbi:LOW QUALITY PROTEIN: E3 ubiquitin-protein ligase RNF8-like [Mya arenaria]|uniref:LOW QUALITY PROTEIN: E3 ubiquitin-protein ligase RNF8-like n=1 Tax=Mya arenaria TaxID=6604 RepID=UPI0022E5F17F|nr:LOW QUALITY PROTEIN: E3 ubiquitin-protein ligase RNF8-like [Mya arenaria]
MATTVRLQCLKRIGENIKKYKLITLNDKQEVTIGRNPDVTVCILSTMISRCHAVLKKNSSEKWTIKDNKSLNGVFINEKKLEPLKPYELNEGDIVQLGVPISSEVPAEFVFKFHNALKVKRERKDEGYDTPDGKRIKLQGTKDQHPGSKPIPESDSHVSSSRIEADPSVPQAGPASRGCGTGVGRETGSPYRNYQQQMQAKDKEAEEKMAAMEAKLKEMQDKLKEKESAELEMAHQLHMEKVRRELQSRDMADLRLKEEQLKLELEKKQEEVAREKREMEEKLREELEDVLSVREATLMESLEAQKQALLKEKRDVEDKLKQELKTEKEKDKRLTDELEQQQQKLQKVIETKEAEQRLLESQLFATKEEKDRQHEEVLRAREDVLANFAELMETELQCSICSELFVRRKMKRLMKQINQSQQLPHPPEDVVEGEGVVVVGAGEEPGALTLTQSPHPPPEVPAPIVLSDDNDDDDDSLNDSMDSFRSLSSVSDDSLDDVSGDEGAYYGGYGRCYTCGSAGHWANGCPFR